MSATALFRPTFTDLRSEVERRVSLGMPADEIESHPSGRNGGLPTEKWRYYKLKGVGTDVFMEFVSTAPGENDYRMTKDPHR